MRSQLNIAATTTRLFTLSTLALVVANVLFFLEKHDYLGGQLEFYLQMLGAGGLTLGSCLFWLWSFTGRDLPASR